MPSWGFWIRCDKPQEASQACLVRKRHDENGVGGLHSAAGGQLFLATERVEVRSEWSRRDQPRSCYNNTRIRR